MKSTDVQNSTLPAIVGNRLCLRKNLNSTTVRLKQKVRMADIDFN